MLSRNSYLNISKVSVVVFVTPPPVPVIVMGYVPVVAVLETVRLKCAVPEPGAAIEAGLKLAVTPEGSAECDREIAALNEPEVVVVTVAYPLWPWSRDPELGETEIVKLAATGAVTVRFTVVVSVVAPEVPVMVIGYVPVGVDELVVNVSVELPLPVVNELGLKLAVTPEGSVEYDSVTAASNPPTTVLVIVDDPALPCTTETAPGEAERLNPGCATVPASVFSSVVPFGLPQPVARS